MEDKEGRPSYMSDQQLEAIVEELDKMDRIRDEKVFYPYYPKGIADSWDYKDPLAKKIAGYLGYICQVANMVWHFSATSSIGVVVALLGI